MTISPSFSPNILDTLLQLGCGGNFTLRALSALNEEIEYLMRILGHRGASLDFPENTLDAMTGAVSQGADGVEFDVLRCASGELVVCHDELLTRLTGQPLKVSHTKWQVLKTLDVGSLLGFKPAKIPLLSEVYDSVPADFVMNLEIKCDVFDDAGLSVTVADFLKHRRETERSIVSSFNPWCLVKLSATAPRLRTGLLIDPDRNLPAQIEQWAPLVANYSVHPSFGQTPKTQLQHWKQQHRRVIVWTVDDLETARQLEEWGVDDVITNRPGSLRRELNALKDL
jgi:glycerophosphoryl diester phosphodiesterase